MAKSRFVSQQHPVKSWKRCQDFKGGVCPLLWPGDPKSRELRLLQNPNRRPRARSCKERFWSPSRSQQFPQANRMIPWFAARSKARKRSGALWRKSWTLMSKCTLKLQPSIGRTREAAVVSLRILIWSPGRWFWTLLQRHLSRCTFVFAKRQTEFCSEQMLAPIKYSPNMSRCIIVTFFSLSHYLFAGGMRFCSQFLFCCRLTFLSSSGTSMQLPRTMEERCSSIWLQYASPWRMKSESHGCDWWKISPMFAELLAQSAKIRSQCKNLCNTASNQRPTYSNIILLWFQFSVFKNQTYQGTLPLGLFESLLAFFHMTN